MNNPVYLTADGLRDLEAELEELINVQRPAMAKRLHIAIKMGDLSENADYITGKEAQGFLEGRIKDIQQKLRDAVLIEENSTLNGIVSLGSHVTVVEVGFDDTETYHIVGATEADPSKGKISHESPLGKALLGKKKDDSVSILAPAGKMEFKIINVL
ncbi:MAG: transcription elongation factor GreA [Anaerolineales bacterium]|nr:MAG: transcription elongation factor GreA [Anaerolineales bacterium]